MPDHLSANAQEMQMDFEFDPNFDYGFYFGYDFDQWIDPDLPAAGVADPPSQSRQQQFVLPQPKNAAPDYSTDDLDISNLIPASQTLHGPLGPHVSVRRMTDELFNCNVPGCRRTKPFAGKFELDRHVLSKHGGTRSFSCRASECFRRDTSRWTFTRQDKLTDHIRSVHGSNTLFESCPVTDCLTGPYALDALGIHIRKTHRYAEGNARAIKNATAVERRSCPVLGCNKRLYALGDFIGHLLGHDASEIFTARESSSFESLEFNFVLHRWERELAKATAFTVGISCPVCKTSTLGFQQFREHLLASHISVDAFNGDEHWLNWTTALAQSLRHPEDIDHWVPWEPLWTWAAQARRDNIVRCASCGYSPSLDTFPRIEMQHPGLLKPVEDIISELYPYRMEILRLYPDFLSHPIFDDLNTTRTYN